MPGMWPGMNQRRVRLPISSLVACGYCTKPSATYGKHKRTIFAASKLFSKTVSWFLVERSCCCERYFDETMEDFWPARIPEYLTKEQQRIWRLSILFTGCVMLTLHLIQCLTNGRLYFQCSFSDLGRASIGKRLTQIDILKIFKSARSKARMN